MIFPRLKAPLLSQVNEEVLLDASKTFANGADEISTIEIQPHDGADWVNVSADKALIWQYEVAGEITAKVRVNYVDVGNPGVEQSAIFTIVSIEEDKLFSTDSDFTGIESEVMDYLNYGKSSFNDFHREAQRQILEELNKRPEIRKAYGGEITKVNIAKTKELNAWSRYLALSLIYYDISKTPDSVFWEKSRGYRAKAERASQDRQFLTIDADGDGPDEASVFDFAFTTCEVVRR